MKNTPGNKHTCLDKKYLVINYFIKTGSKLKTRNKRTNKTKRNRRR